jgi:hypothetical protein
MSRRISLRSIFFETRIMEKMIFGSSGLAMGGEQGAGSEELGAGCFERKEMF